MPSGPAGQVERAAELVDAAGDDLDLRLRRRGQRQHHGVEAAAQRAGEVVDPAVAVVGGGDEVEAADGLHLLPQLGDGQRLLRQDRDQRVLHVGRDAGQLLDPGGLALGHGAHDRAGHQGVAAGAVGEQLRVVPAVADGLLGRARRALHQQRRVAADGGREVLGHPRLRGAGHAEQQQGAVRGERGHGDLDDAARPDVLRRDHRAVRQRAAEQVRRHGPGREPPAAGRGRSSACAASALSSSAKASSACGRSACSQRSAPWWCGRGVRGDVTASVPLGLGVGPPRIPVGRLRIPPCTWPRESASGSRDRRSGRV